MRDSFIFYRSFFEAITYLDKEAQADCFNAIAQYALNGEEIEIDGAAKGLFISIKPQIDANNRRYESGCRGGRPKKNQEETKAKPNNNQNETKGEPKENQTETEVKPNENENVNDINNPHTPLEGEQEPKKKSVTSLIAERNFSKRIQEAVEDWVKYKIEKRQGYKETGLKSFLTQVENNTIAYGEDAVISVIQSSMSSNYQGVVWDKLRQRPPTKTTDWSSIA